MTGFARNRNRRRNRGHAFSLLETLVAVTIFGVAIVALIEGIAASSRTQAWIESENRAVMLAQNILEEIEYARDLRVGVESGQFQDLDSRYYWSSEILETDLEELYEVRVTVRWMEGDAERDFQLVTYLREQEEDETAESQI